MGKQRDVSESQALRADNRILRELLWIRHGTIGEHLLYGDDGEMQCSKCGIDFKRDPAESIKERFEALGLEAIQEYYKGLHTGTETNQRK